MASNIRPECESSRSHVRDSLLRACRLIACFALVAGTVSRAAVQVPSRSPYDLDRNDVVDAADLLMLIDAITKETPEADLNGDERIDWRDLFAFSREWGTIFSPEGPLPPDPGSVAPPLDTTLPSQFTNETEFLYSGESPVQTGADSGAIDPHRISVLRGRVRTIHNRPLPGVKVSVLNHPEYGYSLTRADGLFDLAVNGGAALTISYTKPGYLPAQRKVDVPWQEYVWAPDVVLVAHDENVNQIELGITSMQVVRGSVVSDRDGRRQATLLLPADTGAELVMADGRTVAVRNLSLRATEYTVGSAGPNAMPAELPPNTGYTYCVEFTSDEAIQANAKDVRFSRPLIGYVENFLNFPVGGIVPVGYYDRELGSWIPSENGRIVRLLSVDPSGVAQLDTDGSGRPADPADLAQLGITQEELEKLAQLYQPGQSLWRIPVTHFTPYDCNWPFGPPPDAEPPNQPEPETDEQEDDPCEESGSILSIQNQVLGQSLPIAGTNRTLNYRSDRVPGRAAAQTLKISLAGETLPASVKRIALEIEIAGQRHLFEFTPAAQLSFQFVWDRLDAYGRSLMGSRKAHVKIGYVYDGVYMEPADLQRSFGRYSDVPITGSTAREEITLWQERYVPVGLWDARSVGLGGWTLDIHHAYDVAARTLYFGNGARRRAESLGYVISTVAGTDLDQFMSTGRPAMGDGGPATEALLIEPQAVAVGPDGSIYVASFPGVRRIDSQGIIETAFSLAELTEVPYVGDLAVGPDGSIYVSLPVAGRVFRMNSNGQLTTVAGTGELILFPYPPTGAQIGDGGPAQQAKLFMATGLAVSPDGTVFIADSGFNRVRQITPDGVISTVAGTGEDGFSGDGGPASFAQLDFPTGLVLMADGTLYVVDSNNNRVRRIGIDGIITTVAGNGEYGFSGDGGPATQARLASPQGIAVGPDGSLYIADTDNNCIRYVNPDGVITTLAGTGVEGFGGDGGPAAVALLAAPRDVALAPDGSIYICDTGNGRIRRVGAPSSAVSLGNYLIPDSTGKEVYVFDSLGRHLGTVNAFTGGTIYEFEYDGRSGRLMSARDGYGNTISIERDNSGEPLAIVAPSGQRTELGLDPNGFLSVVTNPEGETYSFSYDAGGLLSTLTDPRTSTWRYEYDSEGRLVRVDDPDGGFKVLSRRRTEHGYEVTIATAEGREETYLVEHLPTGHTRRVTRSKCCEGETETVTGPDGSRKVALADGTVLAVTKAPDPRWGMQVPVPSRLTVTTPAGPAAVVETTRTVSLSRPGDPLSLQQLTEIVAYNGAPYVSSFDAQMRTMRTLTPEGREFETVLNEFGDMTRFRGPGLAPFSYSYDTHGRLSSIQIGEGEAAALHTMTYDALGFLESVSNAGLLLTGFRRDNVGRITAAFMPGDRRVDYGYDSGGNIVSITPPGKEQHLFEYTSDNLLTSYIPPGGGRTEYLYDLDNRLKELVRPDGERIVFSYDIAGRLVSISSSRGETRFERDTETGDIIGISKPDGNKVEYTYNGQLLSSMSWSGEVNGAVGFLYDNWFREAAETVNGETVAEFVYDSDGLLVAAGDLQIDRDPLTGLVAATRLSNVREEFRYDIFGQTQTHTVFFRDVPIYSVEYVRDKLGRIIRKDELIEDTRQSYEYVYDAAGRLEEVKKNGVTLTTYEYDKNGNRTVIVKDGARTTAEYDSLDRLLRYGTAEFKYTENGELWEIQENRQITAYNYDWQSNLLSVLTSDGVSIEYITDGANRRIGKKIDARLVQAFLYKDDLNSIAELDGDGNVVSVFVYATRRHVPSYMKKRDKVYAIISDHLGSVRLVVDTETGSIAQRIDYDAFGGVMNDTSPGFQPFGFAGGLYDHQTGLVRFGSRDYDARFGRWTTKDPVGFEGNDTNLYAYVLGDPINSIDTSGKGFFNWVFRKVFGDYCARSPEMWEECREEEKEEEEEETTPEYDECMKRARDPLKIVRSLPGRKTMPADTGYISDRFCKALDVNARRLRQIGREAAGF